MDENELIRMEEEFQESWHYAEKYFDANVKARSLYLLPLLNVIRELRASGYDTRFRAYFMLFTFVISCARKAEHPYNRSYICFYVKPEGMVVRSRIGAKHYSFPFVGESINTELKVLLDLLMVQPIE